MSSLQCNECVEKQKEIDRLKAECERLTTSLKEMEALNSANQALVAEYEQILGDMDFNEDQNNLDNEEGKEEEEEENEQQSIDVGTPETVQSDDSVEKMSVMIKQLKLDKTNLEIENEELLNKVRELESSQESLIEERDSLLERLALIEDI